MAPGNNSISGTAHGGPILSARGSHSVACEDFLVDHLSKAEKNPYHPVKNPEGVVNMGTAVNMLLESELTSKMNQSGCLTWNPDNQHYYDFSGIAELKGAVANFLTRHLKPFRPIIPQNVVVMNGITSCLDALAHALCDPGDVIITPTPTYSRIFSDFNDVSIVTVEPLVLTEKVDENGNTFVLRAAHLEQKIVSLKAAGKNVKGFALLHPNNPLGDVYSPQLLTELLQVCAMHEVHFISDEAYALTVFDEETEFKSLLSLDAPDPSRTHFLWGFSKDFGLAGIRVGITYSLSEEVTKVLKTLSIFKCTPSILQKAAAALVNDVAWCDEFFLPTSVRKIGHAYQRAAKRLQSMGTSVRRAKGGLFIWIGVHSFLRHPSEKEELELFQEILDAGVYIVPGTKMYCEDPGWFRLITSVSEEHLQTGLDRLETVLKTRREKISAIAI